MKALLSWLQEFAPGIEGDPFDLGDTLSDIGLCCEEVLPLGRGLGGVVVARVLELGPHPDADRIQLVQVDTGDGEALQICCGAFNMAVGDLVPLATIGTTMPNGMEIARRKLRGEWSNGMLCSARELELGDDHGGILILPPGLTPGVPFAEAMGVGADVLFDLDLTPNRPDALSILGIARDLAARLGVPFALPDITLATTGPAAGDLVSVAIADPDLCGRFTARVLSGVQVGPSPSEIARRLTLMGMRPVNSVVDLSNYVMLEYGQPNHTFDLGAVAGGHLRVRRAVEGESLVTLDGQRRTLTSRDGVIADGHDAAIGIAGVMGGASTEISEATTDVLLELAWWDPASIGATSSRLGLRSEASHRFDKGVDPEIAERAADRFCQLAAAQGASVHPGQVVAQGHLPRRAGVTVRTSRVASVLGSDVARDEIAGLLAPLGFEATVSGVDLEVAIPTWRPDATAEIDVIEEVARHRGYASLGRRVPRSPHVGGITPQQQMVRELRAVLVAAGVTEAMPMPFLAPGTLERYGVRTDAVVVTNPLDANESVLRTSLLPGLVGAVAHNAAHRRYGVRFFEVGHCFAHAPAGAEFPEEWAEAGVVLAGGDAREAVALVRRLLAAMGLAAPEIRNASVPGLHPGRSAVVRLAGIEVGDVGEVDPVVAAAEGVDERVGWIRLGLAPLLAMGRSVSAARPVSRFPSADVDLAFVVADDRPADELIPLLQSADELVVSVRLFDVYRGDGVPSGHRSLAYAVRLQATDRTLSDREVAEARGRLIDAAAAAGAVIR